MMPVSWVLKHHWRILTTVSGYCLQLCTLPSLPGGLFAARCWVRLDGHCQSTACPLWSPVQSFPRHVIAAVVVRCVVFSWWTFSGMSLYLWCSLFVSYPPGHQGWVYHGLLRVSVALPASALWGPLLLCCVFVDALWAPLFFVRVAVSRTGLPSLPLSGNPCLLSVCTCFFFF